MGRDIHCASCSNRTITIESLSGHVPGVFPPHNFLHGTMIGAGATCQGRLLTELVYILSPSYSGSTLLTFLMSTHPSIATIGELKATAMGNVDEYQCSCGRKIRQCPFWTRIGEELARQGVPFDVADFGTAFRMQSGGLGDRLFRAGVRGRVFEMMRNAVLRVIPKCRKNMQEVLTKNRVLVDVITRVQDAGIFLDGSKDAVRLKYMLASGYWNIRVIHLIRDGRGTTNSFMKHYDTTMARAATEWRRTRRESEWILCRLPKESWIRVRYEDLCTLPDDTLEGLFQFLGCDPGLASREFRAAEHHILGNSMRLKATSEISLDEKWKRELSDRDLATFERIAGALNRKYGYV